MHPLVRHTVGGREVSGIFITRTGERVTVTQSCASDWYCRPDYIGGAKVLDNWKGNGTPRCTVGAWCTVLYLNRTAFSLVPVAPTARIAIRPGHLGNGALRGPATWSMDLSLAKHSE